MTAGVDMCGENAGAGMYVSGNWGKRIMYAVVWGDAMQSRLRKKGSIPGPTWTDPRLARPGQVLNCAYPIVLHSFPAGTGPRVTRTRDVSTGHVQSKHLASCFLTLLYGNLVRLSLVLRHLLGKQTHRESGHEQTVELNHLSNIKQNRDIRSIFCATKIHGNVSPRIWMTCSKMKEHLSPCVNESPLLHKLSSTIFIR